MKKTLLTIFLSIIGIFIELNAQELYKKQEEIVSFYISNGQSEKESRLSVKSDNAFFVQKGQENEKTWYIPKGENLYIDYECIPYTWSGSPQHSGGERATVLNLFINGTQSTYGNTKYSTSIQLENDIEIKLNGHGYVPDFEKSWIIHVYDKSQLRISSVNINGNDYDGETWLTGEPEIGITATDPVAEIIEIKIKEEKTKPLASLQVNKDSSALYHSIYTFKNNETISNSGKYDLTITAVNNLGMESGEYSFTVKIDKEAPRVEFKGLPEGHKITNIGEEDNWYKGESITFEIEVSDNHSGVGTVKVTDSICGDLRETDGNYKIKGDGKHTVTVTVTDNAGNENSIETIFNLESRTPVIENKKPLTDGYKYEAVNGSKQLNTLTMKFSLKNVEDGEDVTLKAWLEETSEKEVKRTDATIKSENENNGTIYTADYNLEKMDRTKKQEISLVVECTNLGGNTGRLNQTVILPAVIGCNINENFIDYDRKENVTELEITKEGEYEEIQLSKIYEEGEYEEITLERYQSYFSENEDTVSLYEAAAGIRNIKENIGSDGIYEDRLPLESGLGHKKTKYQMSWTYKVADNLTITERGDWKDAGITKNSPGRCEVRITGNEGGSGITITEEGNNVTGNLVIPKTGLVKLAVRMMDYDAEKSHIILEERIQKQGSVFTVKASSGEYEVEGGTDRNRKTGEPGLFRAKNSITEDGWYEFEKPLNLSDGRTRTFILETKEGEGKSCVESERMEVRIKAALGTDGNFTVMIGGDEEETVGDVLTANPWQKVRLSVEPAGDYKIENITWNSGIKGKDSTQGNLVELEYPQNPARTGSTSEYTLTISCSVNGKEEKKEIKVNIEDTQYGELYGNEEWRGEHIVLGNITVKNGQTLNLADNTANGEETKVYIAGSINEEDKVSIVIKEGGTLKATGSSGHEISFSEGVYDCTDNDGKVRWKEPEENKNYCSWGGIICENGSSVQMKKVVIEGAEAGILAESGAEINIEGSRINKNERGIAAGSGSRVELSGTEFDGNGIAVHAYGKCSVELTDSCVIMNSLEYGIKEDRENMEEGSVPLVSVDEDTSFTDNTVNIYRAGTGIEIKK